MKKIVLKSCSLLLGFLFIISGIGKLISSDGFVQVLSELNMPAPDLLSNGIIAFEIALGVAFIFFIAPRIVGFLTIIFLTTATALLIYAMYFKGLEECGCFGAFDFLNLSLPHTLIRNSIFIVLSIMVFKLSPPAEKVSRIKQWSIIIPGLLAFIYSTYHTLNSQVDNIINQNIKSTVVSNYISTSADSTYILFIFKPNCSHCLEGTEVIKMYRQMGAVDKVIGITLPGMEEEEKEYIRVQQPNFPIIHIKKETLKTIVKSIPAAFYIKNDTVRYSMRKTMLSPEAFISKFKLVQTGL